VIPLTESQGGLAIGGAGRPVDWLVMMRRLDERFTLERMIEEGRLGIRDVNRLSETLAWFYRAATPVFLPPAVLLANCWQNLAFNYRVLADPRFALPRGLISRVDRAQRRFLQRRGQLIADRLRGRRIVDGHGDLRPEHIWLDDRVRIIDCLEFNDRLRVVDPLDEIAYLSLECERLGAPWVGRCLQGRMKRRLRDGPVDELFTFYHCQRASLRARLAIAHLLEEHPRTPEKWPVLTMTYLRLAEKSARALEALR